MNKRVTWLIFLILAIGLLIFYGLTEGEFDLSNVRDDLKSFGIWAPLIFVVIYTFATIFIPSTPFMTAAGVLFGLKWGLIYTVIGGILSAILVFFVARKLGQEKIEHLISKNKYLKYLNKYNKRLGSNGFWDLVILRILPIMPFNVLNILMGISKIRTEIYILGTIIGLAPSNIIAVYFGDIISKIF